LSAIWKLRAAEVALIWPADALPTEALGTPKFGRLKALKISQR
jgi:hypothetical protein